MANSDLPIGPYDVPESWTNLDEIEAVPPIENPDELPVYRHTTLEGERSREQEHSEDRERWSHRPGSRAPEQLQLQIEEEDSNEDKPSKAALQLYVHSYLIFFSIWGTLARKGMAYLTTYAGTPIIFDTIWVNFTGCLIMGFVLEDRKMFLYEWGSPTYHRQILMERKRQKDEQSGESSGHDSIDLNAAKKSFLSTKRSIPLYIGLTVGFCGSFTTFSGFILDAFLALRTDRNGGYSFMALTGILIATVSISLSGFKAGAQLAIAFEGVMPALPYIFMRKYLDRSAVLIGLGSWLGAVLLCIFSPHDAWRGRMLFALVLSPLGTFARFHLATCLNGRSASFPAGTFAANVLGSIILAAAWDVEHAAVGGVVGCQVLRGVEDGFTGCLSTVSTWVTEISSLKRKHAYFYGLASILTSLVAVILVSGSMAWSTGIHEPLCIS
ncbi:unnamed protein product [Clonostachys rosea]|uniref:Fluoride export protein 1 n=1 Tax=Bionectria ochroleuca TaxID=29856 RepID=A0ABY6UQ35_BIOOC|nr:unnamed protein product [Clonostachys rosea]